ncbi:MAG: PaaI family thioesterase [SAR324 cluster bacterium]|nr:PaaI family thioesterase [SAR324 cluster bacterium]
MAKQVGGHHPFGNLLGLRIDSAADGRCRAHLEAGENLFNPHRVVHGGALFALADTSMGAALYTLMDDRESCATIEMKMNFIKAVREGRLECDTTEV